MSSDHECPKCGQTFSANRRLERHMQKAHGTSPTSTKRKVAYVAVAVIALGAVLGLLLTGGGGSDSKEAALQKLGATDDPHLGNASAPVAVVTFESPACPACQAYHQRIWPGIKSDYVDSGDIAYYFAQFPAGYSFDKPGSVAQQCVYEHVDAEAFFSFTDALYGQYWKSSRDRVDDQLREWADQAGHDPAPILDCYKNQDTADDYESDVQAGNDNGVSGTPFFFVVGHDGWLDTASPTELSEAIDKALARAG